ncbi:isocitrate lyase/phosphoenolpyruvate mutase family protein [Qaidamihabitans albus]|uniref:isocitrate lyase/phosphoenolpyruvate mutase family protein n=1 Tax=Qaidamihabitans albus TaxID=2795733 RepID=UPI0018F1466F|nr:isocitrate lyase/phosphoenolpyruvate mutase family protein [Qaidamihabitans albus]
MTSTRHSTAQQFRSLHHARTPLVVPHAGNVAAARAAEAGGAVAVSTDATAPDAVARIVAAVGVAVTVDIGDGRARTAPDTADTAATVARVLATGAAGVELTDRLGTGGLRPEAEQCHRIAAARCAACQAGVPLFVNARVDIPLAAEDTRLQDVLDRAAAYVAAGADGILVPGVTAIATARRLVDRIAAPLTLLAGPGTPTVTELAETGAARIGLVPAPGYAAVTGVSARLPRSRPSAATSPRTPNAAAVAKPAG